MTPVQIRTSAAELRHGTNRPFNLNFFAHKAPAQDQALWQRTRERVLPWYRELGLPLPPDSAPDLGDGFDAARLALLLELKPPVVSFHFGLPDDDAVSAIKSAGILIISTATTVAEAKTLEARGVDAIIAQGFEAGGHRGSHVPTAPADGIGTMALVPQVADAVKVPVIAAGGIGDGRGIAAAFALGASGVQMGTAFLSCPEAATDGARRDLLRRACDTDTMVTDAISGRSARAVKSQFAMEMESRRESLPAFPSLYDLTNPLCEAGTDSASFHLYGQAAALCRELPAAELLRELVREAYAAFARLQKS
jgi:nitronate monooxygenase